MTLMTETFSTHYIVHVNSCTVVDMINFCYIFTHTLLWYDSNDRVFCSTPFLSEVSYYFGGLRFANREINEENQSGFGGREPVSNY